MFCAADIAVYRFVLRGRHQVVGFGGELNGGSHDSIIKRG